LEERLRVDVVEKREGFFKHDDETWSIWKRFMSKKRGAVHSLKRVWRPSNNVRVVRDRKRRMSGKRFILLYFICDKTSVGLAIKMNDTAFTCGTESKKLARISRCSEQKNCLLVPNTKRFTDLCFDLLHTTIDC
jgi:hypothetical protein